MTLAALAGGAAIYVAMAACSAEERLTAKQNQGGSDDDPGEPGTSGGGDPPDAGPVDAMMDAMMDAMGDPVPDAAATPPTIVTVPCVEYPGYLNYWAEATFPGKTVEQLARVQAVGHRSAEIETTGNTASEVPTGYYDAKLQEYLIKPGAVAASCRVEIYVLTSDITTFDSVTFVLPND